MRLMRLTALYLGLCAALAALTSHAHAAADASDEPPSPAASVSSSNVASLLSASASSALVSVTAAQFVQWAKGAADRDRHYTLIVFLTASQQCAACRTVERELFSVAAQYQAARYPLLSNATLQRARHPAHHIFFLSFDAHRDETGEGVRGKGLLNLAWFQARNITKVPELIMIEYTIPEGMERGSTTISTEGAEQQSADSVASTPASRYAARIQSMRNKRWERQQVRAAKAAAAAIAIDATSADDAANATDASSATSNATATNTSAAAATNISANTAADKSPAAKPHMHCWRDPAQMLAYPLSSGVQAAQLLAWIRLHTEKYLSPTAVAAGSAARPAIDQPLHRSQVIRPEGLSLASGAAGSIVSAADADFFIVRWFYNVQPFLSSLLLLFVCVVMWLLGRARFAVVPCVAYLWSVCGAMNNILKDMPFIGMDRSGAMFFYPGHGSFVGESILVGALYAMIALCIHALASMDLWERTADKTQAAIPVDSAASASADGAASPPVEGTLSDPLPLLPGQIRAPQSVLEARSAARSKHAPALRSHRDDAEPFVMTTAHWILLFVSMAISAFSILRSIYTKKNRGYNFGYVWP